MAASRWMISGGKRGIALAVAQESRGEGGSVVIFGWNRKTADETDPNFAAPLFLIECKPRTALRLRRVAGAHDDGQARVFRKRRVAGRALAEVEPRAPCRFNPPRVEAVGA